MRDSVCTVLYSVFRLHIRNLSVLFLHRIVNLIHRTSFQKFGLSHMDLVSFKLQILKCFQISLHMKECSIHPCSGLFCGKCSRYRQKAESFHTAAIFHAFRITERLPQHLIAAADSPDHTAAGMRLQNLRFHSALS